MTAEQQPLLSICIATFKRANYIGATLDAIAAQLVPSVEVVIFDGASPDNTEQIVKTFTSLYSNIRYVRADTNSGVDQDYDNAIQHARGTYCWLMTDDDLLVPDAIAVILKNLEDQPELLIVNASVYDKELREVLNNGILKPGSDKSYGPDGFEDFFLDVGSYLSFIGGVIIRRQTWLLRERAKYYGSLFIHFGVIFQSVISGKVKVIATPLIKIRYGNAMWTPRGVEIWLVKWPRLIRSFSFSKESQNRVAPLSLRYVARQLIFYRATGALNFRNSYNVVWHNFGLARSLIAFSLSAIPVRLLNALLALFYFRARPNGRMGFYELNISPGSNFLTRRLAQIYGDPHVSE